MKKKLVVYLGVLLVTAILTCNVQAAGPPGKAVNCPRPDRTLDLERIRGRLPLSFIVNQGQTDKKVNFMAYGPGYSLFLTPNEAVFRLCEPVDSGKITEPKITAREPAGRPGDKTAGNYLYTTLGMKLRGANPKPRMAGREELPGRVNYFKSRDFRKWRTNVPIYKQVCYKDVYPGVDLVYYGNQNQLEYDFVVAPGADPGLIRLDFVGAQKLALAENGDLIIETKSRRLAFKAPHIYQEVQGSRRTIDGKFILYPDKGVGFVTAAYNRAIPLIIDPVLLYSTYLGGGANIAGTYDIGLSISLDPDGNIIVAGVTASPDFPTKNPIDTTLGGKQDPFVTKITADGSALVYSTYLGGGAEDRAVRLEVDSEGNAYIVGLTDSTDFPVTDNAIQKTNNGYRDVFVSKLDPSGALLYSTYLGGDNADYGTGIALDSEKNIYITGYTSSQNFPVVNAPNTDLALSGYADAFITRIKYDGSILAYSTYLGGGENEIGQDIAVDAEDAVYVVGDTYSDDFPVQNPIFPAPEGNGEGFAAKFAADGSTVYSTYLGGGDSDTPLAAAVDQDGALYITGLTRSTDFPTQNPIYPTLSGASDVFITKINASGTALAYSSYLGGSGDELGNDIALDASGNAFVTGLTNGTGFPVHNPINGISGGNADAFIFQMNSDGSGLVFSTLFGGFKDDYGQGVYVDSTGNVYVTGTTASEADFPLKNPLYPELNGQDVFIAKIGEGSETKTSLSPIYQLLNE